MNIQEAVREGLRTKKMIKRKNWEGKTKIIPTNDPYNLMVVYADIKGRLPGRGWQPFADDLMANDWYITEESYQNLTLSM